MTETPIPVFAPIVRALAMAALLLGVPAAAAAPSPQRDVIESFHAALIAVMKDADRLSARERFARLERPVKEALDLGGMIRIAAGEHWSRASDAERTRLQGAFGEMSVATYAARFDGYNGQRFETVDVRPGPRGTFLVQTRISGPDMSPVPITYVMRAVEGSWRAIDVLLESGISELATRRSEYRAVLDDGGADALARTLKRKADELLAP